MRSQCLVIACAICFILICFGHEKDDKTGIGYDKDDKPKEHNLKETSKTFVTNKKYLSLCDAAFKTRSRDDLEVPLSPNAIICTGGDRAVLDEFFSLSHLRDHLLQRLADWGRGHADYRVER